MRKMTQATKTVPATEDGRILMDAKSAAKALGISPRLLWSMTASGEIPVVRIRRRTLYDRRDLFAVVDQRKQLGCMPNGGVR